MSAPTSEVLYTTTPTISEGWYDGRKAGVIRVLVSLAAAASAAIPINLPANAKLVNAKIKTSVAAATGTTTGKLALYIDNTINANNLIVITAAASSSVIAKNVQAEAYTFGSVATAPTSAVAGRTMTLYSVATDGTTPSTATGTFAIDIHYEVFSPIADFV